MDPDDIFKPWLLDKPRSEEEMARIRKEALAFGETIKYMLDKFTCDDCTDRFICTLAFDLYNTDGECLLMK